MRAGLLAAVVVTTATVTFTSAAASSMAAAPPALPVPPPGTALQNPIELWSGDSRFLTDGHHAVPVPSDASIAILPDGRTVVIGGDVVTVLGPDGVAAASSPCPGCHGVAANGSSAFTVRDPGIGDGFEILALTLADGSLQTTLTIDRMMADGDWANDGREWWDAPVLLAADDRGVVVAYDYRPGGQNARGGDEQAIARYAPDGALTGAVIVPGLIVGGVPAPTGTHVALQFGGSSGACYTHADGGVLDLATLEVSLPRHDEPDGFLTWYQLSPSWDGALVRFVGSRLEHPSGVSCDQGITSTPWEATYDTSTKGWQHGPSTVLVQRFGASCAGAVTTTPVLDDAAGSQRLISVTLGDIPVDLGPNVRVGLAPAGCAGAAPASAPATASATPPSQPPPTVAAAPAPLVDVCAPDRVAADLGLGAVERVETCGGGWAYVDPGGEGDVQFIARLRGARWWREILFPSPYCREQVAMMGMPQPLIDRINWSCTGAATVEIEHIVRGDSGDRVRSLQQELVDRGAVIDVDGHFGPGTEAAVRQVQTAIGLVEVDGMVGPASQAALGIGAATVTNHATTDEFITDLTTWLNGGPSGGLPADVVTSLAAAAGVSEDLGRWSTNGVVSRVNGRHLVSYVLSGDGGVYSVMDVCVTDPSPVRWCGIHYLAGH